MLCPHVIEVEDKIAKPTIGGKVAERNGLSKRIISFFGATSSRHLLVIRPPAAKWPQWIQNAAMPRYRRL
jgi:hypothetical protein